ncbi:hypothetical protein KZX43_15085 [Microbacterium sp. EYE_512]|uniref:Major facilitator superfamily (MFS) profile domain-containing protein n=1 Tax=Microbacterium wangchenii TaxID=2541726 RepID=A0ABX5SWT9_9MICO|nr:hypothetical protein [Microbacterium wangchenii]MCK6067809.1 hypothetical protein [Microbacterium sp. EYE_512]QBR89289.1 hypothetical protein E4K62_11735 [Microbacterium wangchenii]TXK10962.1 hypothetical protein FVP99_16805 [Microbacterium wangchenii]
MSADNADRRDAVPPRGSDPRDEPRVVADAQHDTLHRDVLAREKERFGGFKFGAAFFGWLTAMGAAVLLAALVAAVGAAIGVGSGTSVEEAADAAAENSDAVGIGSAIVLAVVLFIAYFAGGYVAGRMARFSGAKQGLAVWLWAIVIAVVVAVVSAIAGSQWDILANLDGFPRIPVTPESATATGILTAVGAAIVTLAGAILGGMAGMRYHRKVDRVGLERP